MCSTNKKQTKQQQKNPPSYRHTESSPIQHLAQWSPVSMPSVTWQRQTESPCYLSSILTQHSHPPKGYPLHSASKQNKAWCCECLVPSDDGKNTAAAGEEKKELWREGGKQWRREKKGDKMVERKRKRRKRKEWGPERDMKNREARNVIFSGMAREGRVVGRGPLSGQGLLSPPPSWLFQAVNSLTASGTDCHMIGPPGEPMITLAVRELSILGSREDAYTNSSTRWEVACVTGAVWIGYYGGSERTDGFWLGQREKVRGGWKKSQE